ncbi:MAG: replicative DNA helicase [Deltaproteobacteria bacterium]|jgi:replicative DNA helicase|nr:replicative DNA helicase [Deltaproteobacteria bacterium]
MAPPRASVEKSKYLPAERQMGVVRPGDSAQSSPHVYTELDRKTEKVLLGTLIRGNGENLTDALEVGLIPEDFFSGTHQEVYSAIADLYNRDQPIDIMTLSDKLRTRGTYESVGTEVFLAELEDQAVGFHAVHHYAKVVMDRAALRRLRVVGSEIALKCAEGTDSVDELFNDVEETISNIRERRFKGEIVYLPDTLMDIQRRLEEIAELNGRLGGVPTGFKHLDRLTGGFQKSDLIILGGRPGMGKTAVTLNLTLNAALPWLRETYKDMPAYSVIYFSMEMSREQILMRILSQLGRLNLLKMRSGGLSPEDFSNLTHTFSMLKTAPIYIDDTAGKKMTPLELRSKARRLKRSLDMHKLPPLGLIVVDYLQLLSPDPQQNSNRNREREVAEISGSLKSLAKEMEVAVLCCSQLKRSDDGAPEISDLRDSGAIEQDADIVAFILRKEVLHADNKDLEGKAELQIKKHRNGPTGVVYLNFIKECSCFVPASFDDFSPDDA